MVNNPILLLGMVKSNRQNPALAPVTTDTTEGEPSLLFQTLTDKQQALPPEHSVSTKLRFNLLFPQ